MSFKSIKISIACLALASLSACTTGYHKTGLFGGFSDKELAENIYRVKFNGNDKTSEQRVWNYWFYRSAELTKEKGFDVFSLKTKEEYDAYMANNASEETAFNSYGYTLEPAIAYEGQSEIVPVLYYYSTAYSKTGYIFMYKLPLTPEKDEFYMDPDVIMTQLQPFIDSKGSTAPPNRRLLMMQSMLSGAKKTGQIKTDEDLKDVVDSGI